MKKVLIVGGGPINLSQLQSELDTKPDLIIGVDFGGSYLLESGALPEILIGDFDSLPEQVLQQLIEQGVEIRKFPATKDQTDLELAVDLALERGASKINILGALGSRIDHTFGNIGLLLKALDKGVEAHLLDSCHDIILIKDKIAFSKRTGWAVSLIPLTLMVAGVTTSGLVFKLENEDLYLHNTRGIHNEFTENTVTINLIEGILLIIIFKED